MLGPKLFVIITPDLIRLLGNGTDAFIWAWIDFRINSEKNAEVYDRDGFWWWRLTIDSLAEETGFTVDVTRKSVDRLMREGHLVAEKHAVRGVSDRAKSYRLATDLRAPHLVDQPETHFVDRKVLPSGRSPKSSLSIKEENNSMSRNDSDEFETWWKVYPRREAKGQARKAFTSALGKIEFTDLLEATRLFAAQWTQRPVSDKKYIPYPSTWLNGERWLDVGSSGVKAEIEELVSADDVLGLQTLTGVRCPLPDFGDVSPAEQSKLSLGFWRQWVSEQGDALVAAAAEKNAHG